VRSCVSPALTLLLATSAAAVGCGGSSGPDLSARARHRPDLVAHDGSTGASARPAILVAAERAITTDARRRTRTRELKDRTLRTSCKPRDDQDPKADAVVYDCLAITFELKAMINAPRLASGYPFQVRVDYPAKRFSWCKIEPVGGEGARQPADKLVIPDASCGGIPKP
jgi:hypothetical protein